MTRCRTAKAWAAPRPDVVSSIINTAECHLASDAGHVMRCALLEKTQAPTDQAPHKCESVYCRSRLCRIEASITSERAREKGAHETRATRTCVRRQIWSFGRRSRARRDSQGDGRGAIRRGPAHAGHAPCGSAAQPAPACAPAQHRHYRRRGSAGRQGGRHRRRHSAEKMGLLPARSLSARDRQGPVRRRRGRGRSGARPADRARGDRPDQGRVRGAARRAVAGRGARAARARARRCARHVAHHFAFERGDVDAGFKASDVCRRHVAKRAPWNTSLETIGA